MISFNSFSDCQNYCCVCVQQKERMRVNWKIKVFVYRLGARSIEWYIAKPVVYFALKG